MSLLFQDGFEGYPDGGDKDDLATTYTYQSRVGTNEVGVDSPGPTGGKFAFCDETLGSGDEADENSGHQLDASALSSASTWIVGFSFRFDPDDEGHGGRFTDARQHLVAFYDSTGQAMTTLHTMCDNIQFRKDDDAGTKHGGGGRVLDGVWHQLEYKVTFHASSGSAVVKLDGEEIINVSGVDTTPTVSAETAPTTISVGGTERLTRLEIDDLYIADNTGSVNNDFLSLPTLKVLRPNGNGATNDFVGSDGNSTDNYLLVDESNPDDDTTYTESGTVSEKDLYDFGAVPTGGTVYNVTAFTYAKKTDSGARTFNFVARSNGTESDSSAHTPTESYATYQSTYETDPDTGSAWTPAGVNAAQFGVKVAS